MRNEPIPSDVSSVEFDLIIIGAGVNGAGVARDAAMRGLQVLLLDKGDIGGETTAFSTRLIHGGLRYLEHGEFGLVRESLRERETLLRIAPQLVKPLAFLLPVYADRRRGLWTIRAGMIAYDLLSSDKHLPRHRTLSRVEVMREAPGLNPAGLRGAVTYFDGQVEFAERLVLENVLSARENGALIATYAEVKGLLAKGRQVKGITLKDQLTGETHQAAGKLVINASGPWVDQVLTRSGFSFPRLIGATKGSHLIVAPFPGSPTIALYVEAKEDQRPIFIIPWNGHYLIGTTDIRYDGPLENVAIESDEIAYLLNETNRLIPSAKLTKESVLFTYSGLRPLAFTNDENEKAITRRHFVREHSELNGLISLIGGKLTTYRSLAEQVVDLCVHRLNKQANKCCTSTTPLPGAHPDFVSFSEDFKSESGLPTEIGQRLLRIYGTRAVEVLDLIRKEETLLEVFDPETKAIAAEVVFAFKSEMAQTLVDCLLRRTMVGLNSTCGVNAVKAAAEIARTYLGWSEDRARGEVENYQVNIKRFISAA